MRPVLILSAMLVSGAMISPAAALGAGDTMQAWKNASDQERSDLLGEILGKEAAGNAKVSRCMLETSQTPGHADLPIGEVAKVCNAPANTGQPV